MAINTEFIDFIIPIETIRQKYPGGWEQCLLDHAPLLGGRVWHDDYLFRDGTMNPMDMQNLVEEWESMGFTSTVEVNGKKHWVDFCVHDMMGGVTLPCDWIVETEFGQVAHINDPEPEVVKHLPPRDLEEEPRGNGRMRISK
jgi:hypothetical protein